MSRCRKFWFRTKKLLRKRGIKWETDSKTAVGEFCGNDSAKRYDLPAFHAFLTKDRIATEKGFNSELTAHRLPFQFHRAICDVRHGHLGGIRSGVDDQTSVGVASLSSKNDWKFHRVAPARQQIRHDASSSRNTGCQHNLKEYQPWILEYQYHACVACLKTNYEEVIGV